MKKIKILTFGMILFLFLSAFSAKFVNTAETFQEALNDKSIDYIYLGSNMKGNFSCNRGEVYIDGRNYKLSPSDNEKPVLFFDGPDMNRHNEIQIKNIVFKKAENPLHIQTFNNITLNNLKFEESETAIVLDGCFNTTIKNSSFSDCSICIEFRNGTMHKSGYVEISGCTFENFSVGIYDASLASKEDGQEFVEISNCTVKENPDFWASFIKKANADSVWNNPKDMALSYRYYIKQTSFDKRLIPYCSTFYESKHQNLFQEIIEVSDNLDVKIDAITKLINKDIYYIYDAYESSKVEKIERITQFLNEPKENELDSFFEDIMMFTNEIVSNFFIENYFWGWEKDWDVSDGPLYELIKDSFYQKYITPVVFILSDDTRKWIDYVKQSKYCYVEGKNLTERLSELSDIDDVYFKKSVLIFKELYDRQVYCLEALDDLINSADQFDGLSNQTVFKSRLRQFKTKYKDYIDAYYDYFLTILFDAPLNVFALSFISEIIHNQDDKEKLKSIADDFQAFYAIKTISTKLKTTTRAYDKVLELFEKYMNKNDYNALKSKMNNLPGWFSHETKDFF